MIRLLLGFLLISTPALGQSTQSDSQTLQAILAELRQIRQDLATATLTTQRIHLVLHRLQAQEAVVSRLTQRLDDACSELAQMAEGGKRLAAEIKRQEEFVERLENSPTDRKTVEAMIPEQKTRLEAMQNQEQLSQAKEAELEVQLRAEQAKLDTLQSDLARLEAELERAAQRGSH